MKVFLAALSALAVFVATPSFAEESSWLFRPGTYSNHPATGERINQFEPLPTLATLPDTRPISSGYRRSLVSQRGPDGSSTQYYRVDNFSGGQGGLDAEWERVNDVWQRSVLAGGWASGNSNGNPGWGGGPGWGGPGWGGPGWGGPGGGGPGWGGPGWSRQAGVDRAGMHPVGMARIPVGTGRVGTVADPGGTAAAKAGMAAPETAFHHKTGRAAATTASSGPTVGRANHFNLQQQGPDWGGQQVQ